MANTEFICRTKEGTSWNGRDARMVSSAMDGWTRNRRNVMVLQLWLHPDFYDDGTNVMRSFPSFFHSSTVEAIIDPNLRLGTRHIPEILPTMTTFIPLNLTVPRTGYDRGKHKDKDKDTIPSRVVENNRIPGRL
jgi:hypothetical protein